jgi:hypothetical protein
LLRAQAERLEFGDGEQELILEFEGGFLELALQLRLEILDLAAHLDEPDPERDPEDGRTQGDTEAGEQRFDEGATGLGGNPLEFDQGGHERGEGVEQAQIVAIVAEPLGMQLEGSRPRSDRRVGEQKDRGQERRQKTRLDRLSPPGDETTAGELDEEDQREAAEKEEQQEQPIDPIEEPRSTRERRLRGRGFERRFGRVRHQTASSLLGRAFRRWK